ncbi:hypothetical protein TFLX_06604 [Thermoflexales bacterium]|nr:hypothetical protein TFLX_06604 [Thermoflexales bacterium]
MDYAIVTDPGRPHYGECGPVEQFHCFYTIRWGPEPNSLEAYFREEVYLFSVNSPSSTGSPICRSSPAAETTVN